MQQSPTRLRHVTAAEALTPESDASRHLQNRGNLSRSSTTSDARARLNSGAVVDTVPKETAVSSPLIDQISNFHRGTGAGEGIRTLDPNLGKVVLYP